LQLTLTVVAVVVAIGSMLFTGFQARSMAAQTALLGSTSRLSYNLAILFRLQDVLLQIADDPKSSAHVWGDQASEYDRPNTSVQSLLDVVAMANAAVMRLPGYANDEADAWQAYTAHLLDNNSALRTELLAHKDWWPELRPFVERLQNDLVRELQDPTANP
jgi:hypothetical protein